MLPHYDASVLGATVKDYNAFTYTPMTFAGLTPDMGQAGERGDIGLVTEWQADYICRGTNLPTVLAQAEAGGTFPWIVRDPVTMAPFNAQANPSATMTFVNKSLPATILTVPTRAPSGAAIYCDVAHEPELGYLPFLLTGDPYYFEQMQFQDTSNCVEPPASSRYASGLGVRALAWGLRTCARLAAITPTTPPSWLLPKSVYTTELALRVAWLVTNGVNWNGNGAPFQLVSQPGLANAQPIADFWQSDFIFAACMDAFRLGQTSVQPIINWLMLSALARTSGTSGWPRARPSLYNLFLSSAAGQPVATTWPDLLTANLAYQPNNLTFAAGDPTGENVLNISPPATVTYYSYLRGALAMAARAGISGAAPAFAWMDSQMTSQLAIATPDVKWMIT